MSEEPTPNPNYAHEMRVWEKEIEFRAAAAVAHLTAITGFANTAINSIILCNSAAAGAALAFIASVWGRAEFRSAVETAAGATWTFAVGATLGMISAALAFFAQEFFKQHDLAEEGQRRESIFGIVAEALRVLGIVTALSGVGAFPIGAWNGLHALETAASVQPSP